MVWEFNRLSHLLTLGRAYALTKNESFSNDFFRQVSSWRGQNPVGRGVNWNCAMEVALRAMNLLGAFALFLPSPQMTQDALMALLTMFDQHAAHIRRNLEFSHVATSNHYLCDVAGLLWMGLALPELEEAQEWRNFALQELLNEMEKQTLNDGADYEASSGYHRLKVELFLYSFLLCRRNEIEIEQKYWDKLRAMIDYVRAYLRPDGNAPLIGDSDSGQVFPIVKRRADDHAYLLSLAAAVFHEPQFKPTDARLPEELLWIAGGKAANDFQSLPVGDKAQSKAFPDAGIYILRDADLYLLFNASGVGVNGRGSHGHNDKLSIEVSACGAAFIVDPGTYVYTADLHERHAFRSTAYHSTVSVDQLEQNTIDEYWPFVIGNEARPGVSRCDLGGDTEIVSAQHHGYHRANGSSITHRRTVTFKKHERLWIVSDEFEASGEHEFVTRFHFNAGLEVRNWRDAGVVARDPESRASLFIIPLADETRPRLEEQYTSTDYGAKAPSISACWTRRTAARFHRSWAIVPARATDDQDQLLKTLDRLRNETV